MGTFLSEPRRESRRARARAHEGLPARLLLLIAAAAAALLLATSVRALDITLQVNAAPPPLPVYDQPPIPAPGYLWVPGYWAYGSEGWFWVPGTWIEPPAPDLVWTPGYWGWQDGMYVWNAGYWGPQVGFYGGIDYGFGYSGHGYDGGYWQDNRFYYNRSVTNITNVNITNVYTKNVSNTTTVNNVSYNGGNGGVTARPTAQEEATAHAHHQGPTSTQTQQQTAAASNRQQLASVNHGRPPIAATPKAGALSGAGIVQARAGGEAPGAGAPPPAKESPLRLSEAERAQQQSQENRPENRPAPPAPETRQGHAPAAPPPPQGRAGPQAQHGNARPEQRPQQRPQHENEKRAEPERKPEEGRPQP
jgi:hypothetical protein